MSVNEVHICDTGNIAYSSASFEVSQDFGCRSESPNQFYFYFWQRATMLSFYCDIMSSSVPKLPSLFPASVSHL